jgi:hypothetical protein
MKKTSKSDQGIPRNRKKAYRTPKGKQSPKNPKHLKRNKRTKIYRTRTLAALSRRLFD